MRAIPTRGFRPVAGKTSCRRTGTASLFENDRPHGGLLRCQGLGSPGLRDDDHRNRMSLSPQNTAGSYRCRVSGWDRPYDGLLRGAEDSLGIARMAGSYRGDLPGDCAPPDGYARPSRFSR